MVVVSCPVGGLSYTCADLSPTFLGCCDINPCHYGNCPPASLFPMGLGDNYTYVPGHSCPNGGQWWTCAQQTPTFQGCCATDPCNGVGCPTLIAAGLGLNASQTAAAAAASQSSLVLSTAAGQSPTCVLQSSSAITYVGTAAQQTITISARAIFESAISSPHSSNTGNIDGGTLAGFAILALIGALVFFLIRRNNKQSIQYGYEAPPVSPANIPQEPPYEDNP